MSISYVVTELNHGSLCLCQRGDIINYFIHRIRSLLRCDHTNERRRRRRRRRVDFISPPDDCGLGGVSLSFALFLSIALLWINIPNSTPSNTEVASNTPKMKVDADVEMRVLRPNFLIWRWFILTHETALMISRVWVPGHVSGTDSCHPEGWREAFITLEEDAGSFGQVGGHLYAPI